MKVLCITDCQDRPETELFIRISRHIDAFTVMSNPDGRNYGLLEAAGLRVIPLKIRSRRDREGIAAIRSEAERGDYDIVHAFNSRAVACALHACHRQRARILGYRGVTTGVGYLKPESWNTYLSPRLDGIFCASHAVRRSLLAAHFLWWRFPADRARTIYKGHDPHWYDLPPAPPSLFGIPEGAITLCCLSRNSHKKGIMTLLDAFDLLPEASDFHLLLVGHIDASQQARKRIARCHFPERVHFTGFREDAVAIIRGSDILVSASESGEGIPRVVVEAMCVETPVVATAAGGTDELVLDGETGLLAPMRDAAAIANALVHTASNPEAAALRVRAARKRIEEIFHPDRTAEACLAWYRELLA